MKSLFKVLFIVICYTVLPQHISLCQTQTMIDEYTEASAFVSEFQRITERRFRSGEIEKMLDAFPVSGREKGAYAGWFNQKSQMKASYSIDSINCNLPILGYDSDRALIQNGSFSIWFSNQDTSFSEFVRFREFVLKKEADSVISYTFESEPAGEYSKVVIKDSDFDVIISPADEIVRVKAEFEIAAREGELPSEISLFFRYPLSLYSISCDGQELQAEHIFTRSAGLPVHQCIIKMPATGERGTRTIKLDYSLNYTNHSLSRKQVGFKDDNGYIVLEAGWYPWFESNFKTIPATISISLPEGLTAVAPGDKIGFESLPGGFTRTTFSSQKETWPFLVWGRYERKIQTIGKSRIEYYLLENEKSDFDKVSGSFSRVWEHMTELLPVPDLDYQRIIEVSRKGGYGPEGNLLIDRDYINNNNISGYETIELLAHELTHSWVNSLSPPSGKFSQFLSEGLATYMGAKVAGELCGEFQEYRLWSRNFEEYQSILPKAVPPADVTENLMFAKNSVYRGVVYFKGAYFFKFLENYSGTEIFKDILEKVLSEKATTGFTMDNLREASKDIIGKDFTYLFEDFLFSTDLPEDDELNEYFNQRVDNNNQVTIQATIDTVLFYLDNNDSDGVLSSFSDNPRFVSDKILRQISATASNWKFKDTSVEDCRFYLLNEHIIECYCTVMLNDGSSIAKMNAVITLVTDPGWKLTSIKFQ